MQPNNLDSSHHLIICCRNNLEVVNCFCILYNCSMRYIQDKDTFDINLICCHQNSQHCISIDYCHSVVCHLCRLNNHFCHKSDMKYHICSNYHSCNTLLDILLHIYCSHLIRIHYCNLCINHFRNLYIGCILLNNQCISIHFCISSNCIKFSTNHYSTNRV